MVTAYVTGGTGATTLFYTSSEWNTCGASTTITNGSNWWPVIPTQEVELQLRQEYEAEASRREDERLNAFRERTRAMAEAMLRAKALLDEHLSAEQRASLAKRKYFIVHSRDGRREYEIRQGRAGNVFLVQNGKRITKFCIHPEMTCPDEDTMLAQKLLLETDEEAFLRIANKTAFADSPVATPDEVEARLARLAQRAGDGHNAELTMTA